VTATAREEAARAAAERLELARASGEQLGLFAAPATPADPAEIPAAERRGPGRPAGSKNRRTSKLRQMLAARGMRMPEDVVAEVAGLGARASSVELAMARAEQVAAWLEDRGGGVPLKRDQVLGIFLAIWKEQSGAAQALLPYGLEKLTPEAGGVAVTNIVLPGAGRPGDDARVIEGSAASDQAAPVMPRGMQEYQRLRASAPGQSDEGSRTE
jgi:hypothetical protein